MQQVKDVKSKNESENKQILQEITYVPDEDTTSDIKKFKAGNGVYSDTFFMYFTMFTGIIPMFVVGTSVVWTSPMIPHLLSNDSLINPLSQPITTLEVSNLAAIPSLGGIAGCLVLPKLADYIGRKPFLLLMGGILLMIYLGKAFCHQFIYLLIYRCLFTLVMNGAIVVLQVYTSDICEDHNRAKFMYLKSLFLPLGNLFAYALGPHVSYRDFNIWCGVPMIPFIIMFCFVPESPVYLLSKGKSKECRIALQKLRSNRSAKELESDFNKMYQSLNKSTSITSATFLTLFKTRENRVATKITIFLSIIMHTSGVACITSFLGPILHEAGTDYSEEAMTIAVGLTQVLSLLFTSFIVERFTRRVLLFVSTAGCGLFVFLIGLFFFLKSSGSSIVPYIQWLPIISISIYFILFGIGLGAIPITVVTEIFPLDLTSIAISFFITAVNVIITILIFLYPLMVDFMGIHWCMWAYGVLSLIGAGLIFKLVPETKGKSNIEIQEILKWY